MLHLGFHVSGLGSVDFPGMCVKVNPTLPGLLSAPTTGAGSCRGGFAGNLCLADHSRAALPRHVLGFLQLWNLPREKIPSVISSPSPLLLRSGCFCMVQNLKHSRNGGNYLREDCCVAVQEYVANISLLFSV